MFCRKCGMRMADDERFCGECGSPRGGSQPDPAPPQAGAGPDALRPDVTPARPPATPTAGLSQSSQARAVAPLRTSLPGDGDSTAISQSGGTEGAAVAAARVVSSADALADPANPDESDRSPVGSEAPAAGPSADSHRGGAGRQDQDQPAGDQIRPSAPKTFCTACGSKHRPEALFCAVCGDKLADQ